MTSFTVLGAGGFVGRHLTAHLQAQGHDVAAPSRDTSTLHGKNLGHVIYCIGLTGNFRQQPFDTIEAHVGVLSALLQNTVFDSWLYLSSTRVYGGLDVEDTASEESMLPAKPSADALYDYSKLLGESLCLTVDHPAMRVARLSNVYGIGQSPHTFLGSLTKDLKETGAATILDNPASSKDYVSIDDVVPLLEKIALSGKQKIYNVASGTQTRCDMLAEAIHALGYDIGFAETAPPPRAFPKIDIARIANEFDFSPRLIQDDLPFLLTKEENDDTGCKQSDHGI